MIMIWYMTTFAGESCFPTPLRFVRASLVIHIWGPVSVLLTKCQPHIHRQFMSVWYNNINKNRTARVGI